MARWATVPGTACSHSSIGMSSQSGSCCAAAGAARKAAKSIGRIPVRFLGIIPPLLPEYCSKTLTANELLQEGCTESQTPGSCPWVEPSR
jgi:hypothetical protein